MHNVETTIYNLQVLERYQATKGLSFDCVDNITAKKSEKESKISKRYKSICQTY